MQVASAQAELSQKVLLVPAAPSSLNASLSLGAIGIMVCCWDKIHLCSHNYDGACICSLSDEAFVSVVFASSRALQSKPHALVIILGCGTLLKPAAPP